MMVRAGEKTENEWCVYVADKPFGGGSWTLEECQKICDALNQQLIDILNGKYDDEVWSNQ